MPTVKISRESMSSLVKKAEKLGITVKDLVDTIIMDHFEEGEDEGEDIEYGEEIDETEDSDDED